MECPKPVQRGRNFRLLDESELPRLLEFLAGYLPESLKFHQTLLTFMKDRVWDFHFYVADNWPEKPICLHFPGMTLTPHDLLYESFGVFCPSDKLEILQLLHEEDILIDWSKPLYINFVPHAIAEELCRLYDTSGTIERILGDIWACDASEEALMQDPEAPDDAEDVQVLPLSAEHAEEIHELYPANDMECHELFLRLIGSLQAAGVFVQGRLAAWMIQSYYGAMFSMQTKPEYRRKGYGSRLARYLTKRVAGAGYTPFVVIRPENKASQSLYEKLGFRNLYRTVRATFTPTGWQEETTVDQENLQNAVRQLRLEHRVMNAFQGDDEASAAGQTDENARNQTDLVAENGLAKDDECCNESQDDSIDVEQSDGGKSDGN